MSMGKLTFAQKCVLDELRAAGASHAEELPTYALWWWNTHSAAATGRRRAFMGLARKGLVHRVRWQDAGELWYLTHAGVQAMAEVEAEVARLRGKGVQP